MILIVSKKRLILLLLAFTLTSAPALVLAGLDAEDDHPVVYDGLLLGGSQMGVWIAPKALGPRIKGGESYQLYSPVRFVGNGKGGPLILAEPAGAESVEVKSPTKDPVLAVCGRWNALPRVPKAQKSNLTYDNIVAEVLKNHGLVKAPAKIGKNYRIDLDGDGTEEVVLQAGYMPELGTTCKKGTYSFILLRKLVRGKAENILLEKAFYPKDTTFEGGCPTVYDIAAIADLNGDGVMEIIVGWKYYEGNGYAVYEVKKDRVRKVLENGNGA